MDSKRIVYCLHGQYHYLLDNDIRHGSGIIAKSFFLSTKINSSFYQNDKRIAIRNFRVPTKLRPFVGTLHYVRHERWLCRLQSQRVRYSRFTNTSLLSSEKVPISASPYFCSNQCVILKKFAAI